MDYHEVEEKEGSEKEVVIGAVAAPSNVEDGEIETLEPDHSQERSDRGNNTQYQCHLSKKCLTNKIVFKISIF